jgi:hypothetical protein
MVRPVVHGIDGVLRTLLTEPAKSTDLVKEEHRIRGSSSVKPGAGEQPPKNRRIERQIQHARRGRPPSSSRTTSSKQKVTVRIRSELIDAYRDWSWELRTPLSRLVERALLEYRKRNTK